ncbi:MAG: DUF438 domain-containing protein, partial [Bacteroidales bacterium]|nr:DUF438 domain-containing protein [Bacteroidales bacterium]
MGELINNNTEKLNALISLCRGLIKGEKGLDLFNKHGWAIDEVTPHLTLLMIDRIMQEGLEIEKIKKGINKILNLFYKNLAKHKIEPTNQPDFIKYLLLENQALENILQENKANIKLLNKKEPSGDETELAVISLKRTITKLKEFDNHYIKKENILFPFFEKHWEEFRCLNLMWSYHDDIRESIKKIEKLIIEETIALDELNQEMGSLYFLMYAIAFREEAIVLPLAIEKIPEKEWRSMHEQTFEIGFSLIDPPKQPDTVQPEHVESPLIPAVSENMNNISNQIDLETGKINIEQLLLIFNHLPVDITYVDENDEVRFFSNPPHRIFPRSKAIIGRKIQNCHPPDSVHIVDQI